MALGPMAAETGRVEARSLLDHGDDAEGGGWSSADESTRPGLWSAPTRKWRRSLPRVALAVCGMCVLVAVCKGARGSESWSSATKRPSSPQHGPVIASAEDVEILSDSTASGPTWWPTPMPPPGGPADGGWVRRRRSHHNGIAPTPSPPTPRPTPRPSAEPTPAPSVAVDRSSHSMSDKASASNGKSSSAPQSTDTVTNSPTALEMALTTPFFSLRPLQPTTAAPLFAAPPGGTSQGVMCWQACKKSGYCGWCGSGLACCRNDPYVMIGESSVPSECKGVGGVGAHKCVQAVAAEGENCGSNSMGRGLDPRQCGAGLYCDVGSGVCMTNPSAPMVTTTIALAAQTTTKGPADLDEKCSPDALAIDMMCRQGLICDLKFGTCVPDLGEAQAAATTSALPGSRVAPVSGVQHWGTDCWPACGKPGFCDWCGQGMVCCRKDYWDKDPAECHGITEYGVGHQHTCVKPLVSRGTLACANPGVDVYDNIRFNVTPASCCDGAGAVNDGTGKMVCPR